MAVKSSTQVLNGQFRNKIINGNFDFWQRGTSLTAASGARYLSDRWSNQTSSSSTIAVSRQAFTAGQTDVPGEPAYFHQQVIVTGGAAGSVAQLIQCIEDVRTFAGKTITLTFYAKADSSKNMAVSFQQNFGAGGSTGDYGISATTCALTSSWQKFTVTGVIPSIAGKTIGTDHYFGVVFWYDAGSTYASATNSLGNQSGTFGMSLIQVEEGVQATAFEKRPIGVELALCQRYYEKSYDIDVVPGTAVEAGCYTAIAVSTSMLTTCVIYKVTKRANAACSIWARNGTAGKVSAISSNNAVGTTLTLASGGNGVGIQYITDSGSGFTAGAGYRFNWENSAEF